MSIKQKISNFFKKYWQLLLGVVAAIIAFIIGAKRNEENDTRSVSDIADPIISDNIAEFGDRSEQVLRGIFSDRGHTRNPSDSGTTDSGNGAGDESGVRGSVRPEGSTDIQSPGTSKDLPNGSNSHIRSDYPNINRHSYIPITRHNKGFLDQIEGPMIMRKGDHLFAILSMQQTKFGTLTAREVIEIYNQARKDPSIMNYGCVLGKKGYLITYHASKFYNENTYLEPCDLNNCDYKIEEWKFDHQLFYKVTSSDGRMIYYQGPSDKSGEYVNSYGYRWV